MTFWLLILVAAEATKIGSCDIYRMLQRLECLYVVMRSGRNMMVNFKPGECMRKIFSISDTGG